MLSESIKTNKLLRVIFGPIRWAWHKLKYNYWTDKIYIKKTFEENFGYKPDLQHPRTFSEKIQWIKLNHHGSKLTVLADKLLARDYVARKIGGDVLIPLHLQTSNVQQINASNLPDTPIVIKTNHASGKVFIIKDKSGEDFKRIRKELTLLLQYNFYHAHREWHYKNIKPRIMVEQFIEGSDGGTPEDYKFHCFAGEVKYIQIDTDRFETHKRIFYDTAWNKIMLELRFPPATDMLRPPMLERMLNAAKALSTDFPYVRVDLYATHSHVYFGELTFTPGAGFEEFTPQAADKEWGSYFNVN